MKRKDKITEQASHYEHLERMSVVELLQHINEEDALVAEAVQKAIPQIEALVKSIEPRMKRGGRLFYVGAGTSGRLGVLDASELPPTFGVPDTWVIGLIAGGEQALRHAVEKAEDVVRLAVKNVVAILKTVWMGHEQDGFGVFRDDPVVFGKDRIPNVAKKTHYLLLLALIRSNNSCIFGSLRRKNQYIKSEEVPPSKITTRCGNSVKVSA